jgi:hypothetical protein
VRVRRVLVGWRVMAGPSIATVQGDGAEFFYHQGSFYTQVGELEGRPVYAYWGMEIGNGREVHALPEQARPVWIGSKPDDAEMDAGGGQTWQQRGIAAELEAANLRARVHELEQRAVDVEGLERGHDRAMRGLRGQLQDTERRHTEVLRELAEATARAYQDAASQQRWDAEAAELEGWSEAEYGSPPEEPTFGSWAAYIRDTLARDHPSIAYPEPGERVVKIATSAFRAHISGPGADIDGGVRIALIAAADLGRTLELRAESNGQVPE